MPSRVSRSIRSREFWVAFSGCAIISAILLTLVSGCSHKVIAKGDGSPASDALVVAATTPRVQTIRRSIVQPGFISSYEETPIFTKIAGYLKEVGVDIGDKIKKDQLLGLLWVPEVEKDVAVKEARIKQGKADVTLAREMLEVARANIETWDAKVDVAKKGQERAFSECDRWKNEYLQDRNAVKQGFQTKQTEDEALNQYTGAQARVEEAKAKVTSAEASLNESKAKLLKAKEDVSVAEEKLVVLEAQYREQKAWFDYARITAPYDGIVTRRHVHTGHFVQPSNSGTTSKSAEPLFMFMRTDRMRVVILVPENDADLVKDGADAIVRIQSLKDREILCKVTQNAGSLNTESRTLRVEIFLDNPNAELLAGMYVSVSITADLSNAMTVPIEAIITEGTKNYCFVIEEGKARKISVKVGVDNERYIQLFSKQSPSTKEGEAGEWVKFTGTEQIILSNLSSIKDGQPVAVK
jgi:multidrug efflux pump subunit AcrA (membrane-fusion protein)